MSLLRGRVAIVTGAGRGIGAATAQILAGAGAAVTLVSRTAEQIEQVANQIHQAKGLAMVISTDVANSGQVQTMVHRTLEQFGRVDFLINCAAITGPVGLPTWEVDSETWRQAVEVDLVGTFLTCHAVLPTMLKQGSGRLLNFSSRSAVSPVNGMSAYGAAKAGVSHFTRVVASELIGTGVTANVVDPGAVETEIARTFRVGMFGEDRQRVTNATRDPIEPARLILWLCSPETSRMTGQIVLLDDPIIQSRLANFLSQELPAEAGSANEWLAGK